MIVGTQGIVFDEDSSALSSTLASEERSAWDFYFIAARERGLTITAAKEEASQMLKARRQALR